MAPFREFLALVILDGDFDLPQHLSVDPAHRRAQLGGGFRGIKIEDAQEILMLEAVVRFKPAAGHERVGDADGGGTLEGRSYVELIIPVKKGIVNDGEDIPLIVPPVFLRKLRRDALKLVGKPSFPVHTVAAFQHGAYRVCVFLPVFPQIAALWKFPAARVRHVEHIPKPRPFAAAVDEGDALGAPADIPAHLFVPEVILRAGGGVRTLGVDHDLLGVGVFVQPCGGGEKACPAPVAAGDLPLRLVRHLHIRL